MKWGRGECDKRMLLGDCDIRKKEVQGENGMRKGCFGERVMQLAA